jgi:uncharacterized protein with HEPN domain
MSAKRTDDLRMLEIKRLVLDTYQRIEVLGLTEDRIVRPGTYEDTVLVDTLYMNVYRVLEEASNIDFETQVVYRHVPWNSIRGMRNRFAHDYGGVNPAIVWETVQTGFPVILDMANDYIERRGL